MAVLLGIDTGGTYTDAVLYDDERREVLRTGKALTTKHDLALGIDEALESILADGAEEMVSFVCVSTTLATNTIVEGQGNPVCLILVGQGPETLARAGLGEALGPDPVVHVAGGHTVMGEPQCALDSDAVREAVERHASDVSAFAVAGYFATRNATHEVAVRELVREATDLPVTCSHELSSRLDAPKRALTTVLNARLIGLLRDLVRAVEEQLRRRAIAAPLMVVKGDGSIVSAATAMEKPVETILSGPAASVVGAHHLSGLDRAVVADIGGTTTDLALIEEGRPRLNPKGAVVGGWRTMVEAVDVNVVGLGGDSEVRVKTAGTGYDAPFLLGPRRAVPLSLLASTHPDVLPVLEAEARNPRTTPRQGCFALLLRDPEAAGVRLGRHDAAMLSRLREGPLHLMGIEDDYIGRRALDRLVERGFAVCAGLTPSDAAHLLGHQAQWSCEAARLGAEIWRGKIRAAGWEDFGTAEDLAAGVHRQAVRQAAAAVAATALTSEDGEAAPQSGFFDRALRDRRSGEILRYRLELDCPVVAVGAGAQTYFPPVGPWLSTHVEIPLHAGVCNAVGAVVGSVVQRATVLVSLAHGERFRVHLRDGFLDFTDLDAALEKAASAARDEAQAAAHAAGAAYAAVTVRHDDVRARVDGEEMFVECRVVAQAVGRPATAPAAGPARPAPIPGAGSGYGG